MERKTWKVLQIDDDEDEFILTQDLLKATHYRTILLDWAGTYENGLRALASDQYDAVLVDYDLGLKNGIQLIQEAVADGFTVPFLLVTGRGSYDVDLAAMEAGAVDYLNKNEINGPFLERAIRYAIERKQTEGMLSAANAKLVAANRSIDEQKAWLQRQEQLLEKIFQISPVGVAVLVGPDLRFELFNPAYRNCLPYPERLRMGKSIADVMPPKDGYPAVEMCQQVLESGQNQAHDRAELLFPDNSKRYMSIRKLPLDWNGLPSVLSVVWETTEQEVTYQKMQRYLQEAEHRAEELLQAENQLRYQAALLDTVSDAIIACDLAYIITYWNHGAELIYGWKADEVVGRNLFDVIQTVISPEDRQRVWKELADVGAYQGKFLQVSRNGDQVEVDVRGLALHDSKNQRIGYVAVNRELRRTKNTRWNSR